MELFTESGFAGTGLNQIVRRANVTPGAFYYHFESKEDVAFAIIDDVGQRMADLRNDFLASPAAGLEDVIAMTFQLSVLLNQDPSYRAAAYLEHTVARHTQRGIQAVADRVEQFVAATTLAIRDSVLRDDVSPQEAARTMVTLIYGSLAMSGLIPGDISTRLAESWLLLLPGIVAPDSLPHFRRIVSDSVDRYRTAFSGSD